MSEAPRPAGRCYEDFEVGTVMRHPLGRTLTATDNTWFTLLTVNSNPIHFDRNYAAHFAFIDHVLGTAIKGQTGFPEKYGVVGDYVPDGFTKQLVFPFRSQKQE